MAAGVRTGRPEGGRVTTPAASPPAIPPSAPRPGLAPGAGALTPAPGSIRLAAQHFAAATLYLLAAAAGIVWVAPELAGGVYLAPRVAGVTHLFTLGWLTMTIFGALCQLLPVALGAPIRSALVADVEFWSFAPGVGLFAAGVATASMPLRIAGMLLVGAGVLLAIGNVAASLPRARSRDATWTAVALALGCLGATLVLGMLLLHNLHTGFIAAARLHVLAAHLHLAIAGWALIMIVGVSHRLLPMFLLSHGADTRWTRRALVLLSSGVAILAIGLLAARPAPAWAGAILLEAGIACFLRQAYAFYRVRVRRQLDVGMRYARTALAFLVAAALLGPAALAWGAAQPRLATVYVLVGLLGGIVLYVIGFFYKIVPLLAWTVHYRGRMGKGAVPTVAQTYSERVATGQLRLMAGAVLLLAAGIALGSTAVTRLGGIAFLAGVLLFAVQLAGVARGRALGVAAAGGGNP
jgi:hypothetical protein